MLQHVTGFSSYLRLYNIPLYVCALFSLSIHLSVDTCFQVLAVVNNATVNVGVVLRKCLVLSCRLECIGMILALCNLHLTWVFFNTLISPSQAF